jgi:hypothetical protein
MSEYPHSALSLLVQSSRVSPPLRAAVAEVEAYLAELDSELYATKVVNDMYAARWESLPPCPTCGGTKRITNPQWLIHTLPCPDCIDGKVSIERLVAVFNAVWDKRLDPNGSSIDGTITYLRSVKPQPR